MDRVRDRREAGRLLGERLAAKERPDAVVLGLPRGGVPVAAEVARLLDAPLDVLVVRKIGAPSQPELAVGAVGEEDALVVNDEIRSWVGMSDAAFAAARERETAEVVARATRFRQDRKPLSLRGRTAIIVDDGVATGATAAVACQIARARGAASVVLAVPVAAPDSLPSIPADEVVCLAAPDTFMAVGMHYTDFCQTTDEEVIALLAPR